MTALIQALRAFVDRYHASNALVAEQSDWCCGICLESQNSPDVVHLAIESGRVVHFTKAVTGRSLIVRSELSVLVDILAFRRDPNEPYLFGELTVEGAEEDFMRLDYIVTRLCAQ